MKTREWIENKVTDYLKADPLRARRIIRAANLPHVRVGAKPTEKKGESKSGE
jgi:hypothetical protein